MAKGTNNVEDCLFCNDSSYGERNLEAYDSGNGVNSGIGGGIRQWQYGRAGKGALQV